MFVCELCVSRWVCGFLHDATFLCMNFLTSSFFNYQRFFFLFCLCFSEDFSLSTNVRIFYFFYNLYHKRLLSSLVPDITCSPVLFLLSCCGPKFQRRLKFEKPHFHNICYKPSLEMTHEEALQNTSLKSNLFIITFLFLKNIFHFLMSFVTYFYRLYVSK